MEIWKAIILGLVQGLTEFLPVSSSGHLVLVQEMLDVDTANILFFDTMLHLATLIAVCVVLYKEIWALLKKPIQKPVLLLIIATIPAGIVGLCLNDVMDSFFAGTKYLWIFFIISACILLVSDILGMHYDKIKAMKKLHGYEKEELNPALFSSLNYGNTIAMGLAQAVAIFPGVTRSGSTIAAGVCAKGDRKEVARFSFLMSIPIILASVLLETIDLVKAPTEMTIGAGAIICGMLAAAISGYIAIKWMLKLVEKCQLRWFSLYLILIAILVIVHNQIQIW